MRLLVMVLTSLFTTEGRGSIPALDRSQPTAVKTATFALG